MPDCQKKLSKVIYVGQTHSCAKFGANPDSPGFLANFIHYTQDYFIHFSRSSPTGVGHTGRPINGRSRVMALTTYVESRNVPYGCFVVKGSNLQKSPLCGCDRQFQAKLAKYKKLAHFQNYCINFNQRPQILFEDGPYNIHKRTRRPPY